jgi:DNA-binding NtrC family response regulator
MDTNRPGGMGRCDHEQRIIAVVTGDPPVRDRLIQNLRRASYAAEVARTCETALELARERGCEVAIVGLEGLDRPAYAVLQTLRWLAPNVRVLEMVTAASVEMAIEALRSGPDEDLPRSSEDVLNAKAVQRPH